MPIPAVIRKLPILNRVVAQIDTLRSELDAAQADRIRLDAELLAASSGRDALLAERDRLLADLVALRQGWGESRAELEVSQEDRARLHAELLDAWSSRDALLAERDRLLADLAALRRRWDELRSELAASQVNRARLHADLLDAWSSRDALLAERDRLLADLVALRRSWDELHSERDALHAELVASGAKLAASPVKQDSGWAPPGHFYSPIPALDEIRRDESRIFGSIPRHIPGVELHQAKQLELLERFVAYYGEMPFRPERQQGLRYYFENPSYSYSDAILSHCMIRFLEPKRIIEIGSGYSSCMILDTNELFFGRSIATTFMEPYPQLLTTLIEDADKGSSGGNTRTIASRLQDVDLGEFDSLRANDILFVDSTHVSKINSDVNRIFFDILPRLASGVHVHFHDIFFPFEYPKDWVYEGRAWNEAYLLRAFLQYNSGFRVVLMNTFMQHFHRAFFERHLPLCLQNTGASIWIRKE